MILRYCLVLLSRFWFSKRVNQQTQTRVCKQAACYGVAYLSVSGTLANYFETRWGNEQPQIRPAGRYCVMAPGTGLGTAAINADAHHHDKVYVVPMEGGHSLCQAYGTSHPGFAEEKELFADFALAW